MCSTGRTTPTLPPAGGAASSSPARTRGPGISGRTRRLERETLLLGGRRHPWVLAVAQRRHGGRPLHHQRTPFPGPPRYRRPPPAAADSFVLFIPHQWATVTAEVWITEGTVESTWQLLTAPA